jgi:hypothetical protein
VSWVPTNNQYDGVNSTPVDDVELNAPYYDWLIQYFPLSPVQLFAPLLTQDQASSGTDPDTGERPHTMRLMVVPPERGRVC